MQLGEFLNTLPVAPFQVVKFRVVHKNGQGHQTAGEVTAALVFVDSYDLADLRREAQDAIDQAKGGHPPLNYENEELYHFLARALRDSTDPRRPFVDPKGGPVVTQLKKAILPRVAGELMAKYNDFVKAEFPKVLTAEEADELQEEAEKNS